MEHESTISCSIAEERAHLRVARQGRRGQSVWIRALGWFPECELDGLLSHAHDLAC